MTIERLRAIIDYSKIHATDIQAEITQFCNKMELQNLDGVRNIIQLAKTYLTEKSYLILQVPLKDAEIGAFVYKGDVVSYLVINSSMPVLNTNLAFCHELYHIFFPAEEALNKARVDLDYYSNEDEIRANLFAGNVLMPEAEFRQMFYKFKAREEKGEDPGILVSLMNYFKVPFMAVYIRCYELGLITRAPKYLELRPEMIEAEYEKHWFDTMDLKPSGLDNSEFLFKYVEAKGCEYLNKGYVNARTLQMVLENMKKLLSKVKAGN